MLTSNFSKSDPNCVSMIGSTTVRSVASHILVALSTFVLVQSYYNNQLNLFQKSKVQCIPGNDGNRGGGGGRIQYPVENTTDAKLPTDTLGSPKYGSKRIDFLGCPKDRIRVAPKVNYLLGMGHKMTEVSYVFWYAMTRGHCFCFDTDHFGNDVEIYNLLLRPVFPACNLWNHTFQDTTVKILEHDNPITLAQNSSIIQWIYPDMSDVWPRVQQEKTLPGHGDLLAFLDSFLRDNNLVNDMIYPWYRRHRSIDNVFGSTVNSSSTDKILKAAFHIRVGDLVLEASVTYWRNVFEALEYIVNLEYDRSYRIHIYWAYFQAHFNGGVGDQMREKLSKNVIGDWPSESKLLPSSHSFLANLCREFDRVECFWKYGTSTLETIDLFVESDIVYVSGSSFSQALSLFNRGIRIQALTKEINYFGTATKGSIPFLAASTGAFSSTRYYYIDGTGELFDEHYAYLRYVSTNTSK
jgi:hypothetical protein